MESGLSILKSQINSTSAKKAGSGEICKNPEQPSIPTVQISDKHSHGFDHFEHHSQFTDDLSQGKFAFHVKQSTKTEVIQPKKKKRSLFGNRCDYMINKGETHSLSTINEEEIFEKIKELDTEFKKTEYNCQRKHHHNPGTNIQITALKKGEVRAFQNKEDIVENLSEKELIKIQSYRAQYK